jgi:hypothetical protein
MSELKVGDIEISGTSVRIGGTRPGEGVPESASPTTAPASALPPRLALQAALRVVPGAPAVLVVVGLGLAVMGLIGAIGGGLRDPLTFVLRGAALLPVGIALTLLGTLKGWIGRAGAGWTTESTEPVEARLERLGHLLAEYDRTNTVANIARRLGWSEPDVVRALAWLRERNELLEELDTDTGNFYYVATPRSRDLAARIRHLGTGDLTP